MAKNSSEDYINTTARHYEDKSNSRPGSDRNEAEEELDSMRGMFANADKKITDYIKKNPKKAALIAAAVGAAIGAALAMMLKNERKK
jgi:hypothetical protein